MFLFNGVILGLSQFFLGLRPRFSPPPRFAYRRLDVPAASRPPLAACMVRLVGSTGHDVGWEPFCGSGPRLIERGLLGGVRKLLGSDLGAEAIDVANCNLAASGLRMTSDFSHGSFRHVNLAPSSISQIISNPPMGRRAPIPDLKGLINKLFDMKMTLWLQSASAIDPGKSSAEDIELVRVGARPEQPTLLKSSAAPQPEAR